METAKKMVHSMSRLRQMSWKKLSLIGAGVGLAAMALMMLTVVTLVVGTPVLIFGGIALLLVSPCLCCTAPLWLPPLLFIGIPTLIFFVVTGGIAMFLAVMTSVGSWWLYRYRRGPMPPGGHLVERMIDRLRNAASRTKSTLKSTRDGVYQVASARLIEPEL
ncbi:hypothetical protein CBR_g23895 [Chara braunii]|uniref:Oleosin n=1 Tax=Chara braunii TaxID=69332 RepID=A0A388L566_CHABU|nr:hypothetical protein CBR_g23895 [Chara braunii]|eukprot:GBG77446.1 hypothetical protein CBR_g23895 [Chara braunii]